MQGTTPAPATEPVQRRRILDISLHKSKPDFEVEVVLNDPERVVFIAVEDSQELCD